MEPIVSIMRRFAVDFFSAHNLDVCGEIMSEDYQLTVGRTVITGRDQYYRPAVESQLTQFPGLMMTVHDLVVTKSRAALHFTEHGASGGSGGPTAAWSGVALFEFDGSLLVRCFANEDYHARRRQLKGGVADPVQPPATAPWDVTAGRPNPHAEATVVSWLNQRGSACDPAVRYDDEPLGPSNPLRFRVHASEVVDLFSADNRVAFAVMHRGNHHREPDTTSGEVEMFSTGIVTVCDGRIISGYMVRDRVSMLRAAA
jgi:hypothetical protein